MTKGGMIAGIFTMRNGQSKMVTGGDHYMDRDEYYEKLYKVEVERVSAGELLVNGAFTEEGDQVYCDGCGEEMKWDPETRKWQCRVCGNFKTRAQWFSYIDADPPGNKCLTKCQENYPICKRWCFLYKIPDDDPIL